MLCGGVDILVTNAAWRHVAEDFVAIPPERMERTIRSNPLGTLWMMRIAPHAAGGAIIDIAVCRDHEDLVHRTAIEGAIVAFTRSLAAALAGCAIQVGDVAPGRSGCRRSRRASMKRRPARHGASAPMQRAGEPDEVAPSFIFLASRRDSGDFTGRVPHPNDGMIVNGRRHSE